MEKGNCFTEKILLNDNMDTLFEKSFLISDSQGQTETYTLPNPTSVFKKPPWQLENLQMLKASLNEMKSRLNNFDLCEWQQHTSQMNKAGDIVNTVKKNIQAELVTQAWCKFYEIASKFFLIPLNQICCEENGNSFTSVHLCEAPGAFVTALNHWLKTNAPDVKWNWLATTLNPYCEGHSYDRMVSDDRFIRHTLKHWCFGADNTGDIMNLRNLDVLIEEFKQLDEEILLVTADGSIDCTDVPGEQENAVAQLHLCETVTCMHLLQKGGNFLLKLFTLFEHQSICLIYLLSCSFHQVIATKPASSKAGNSEIYVICMNFKGRDYVAPYLNIFRHYCGNVSSTKAMFDLQDIPATFLRRLQECSEFFKHYQCQVIRENISTFRVEKYSNILFELKHIKRKVVKKYLKTCRLSRIDSANEIVGRQKLEKSSNCFTNKKWHVDSYNERCKRQDLIPQEHLLQICNKVKEIETPMERSYTWHLRAPTLEIRGGRSFNKVRSSHFCDSRIQQMLNKIDDILRDTRFTMLYHALCFPSAETIEEQRIDPTHEMLCFQFVRDYDSHRTIADIYNRLEKLQIGQTLVLIGYSLLTQLNVGLLYLLGGLFDKITVEICYNEGYRIKLEKYKHDDKILSNLHEIFMASTNILQENMTIWSIIPITFLYECDQFPVIIQLNHLMIKLYAYYISMIECKT